MKYAKLIDGEIYYAPKKMKHGDSITYNPTVEMIIAEGYKPVNEVPAPEAPEGYCYEVSYEDIGDSINFVWTLVEEEPSAETLLAILMGDI